MRAVPAPRRAAPRHHGRGAAAASTPCATATPRWCAGCCGCPRSRAAGGASPAAASRGSACDTPTGFLPEEDQGAFFVAVQLPDGASVARTRAVTARVEDLLQKMPQVSTGAVDRRLLAARRRRAEQRGLRRGAPETVRRPHRGRRPRAGGDRAGVRRGAADPLGDGVSVQPAADHRPVDQRRLRVSAGEPRRPRAGRDGQRDAGLVAAANQDPRLSPRVLHLHRRPRRRLLLDIDRDKAQALGVNVSDVFTALQATLGGIYVNDFNLFGRTWQVNIEAEDADRNDIPAIWRIFVRNNRGTMVPLRSLASMRYRARAADHQPLQQLPFRSPINGKPRAGVSSGDALAAMAQISARTLPPGYRFRMDRHRLSGNPGERPDRHPAGAGGAVRLSVPGGPVRKLGDPDAGAAVGQRSACSARSSGCAVRACRSISTRRSAWWC